MKKEDFFLNEMIAVYTDTNDEWFGAGMVFKVDDDFLMLKAIDPTGIQDGLILYCIKDIVKIERNTLYLQKLKKLMNAKNTTFPDYKICTDDFVKGLLQEAKKREIIVCIQLLQSQNCDVMGIVKEINSHSCTILQVNSVAQFDGECQFDLENISSIKFDSNESRDINLMIQCEK